MKDLDFIEIAIGLEMEMKCFFEKIRLLPQVVYSSYLIL